MNLIICTVWFVVVVSPALAAKIAEVVPADAGYMIAAFLLLYDDSTLLALFVVEVLFQEVDLKSITVPLVLHQQTLAAEVLLTGATDHYSVPRALLLDDPIAFVSWTELYVVVFVGKMKLMDVSVSLLDASRQLLEEW